MNNIYKTLLLLLALTLSVNAQTGDNTKIFYDFKDALWNQASTTAKDTGSPGGSDATVNGTNVTFVNNGTGGTAIQYSITTADAKLDGVTADWGEKFVLEARIKKSALEEGGTNSEIHILKNVATTGLDWYIDTNNKMVLKVGNGSGINIISDTPVIGDGTWITLAAVVDLSQGTIDDAVKFFINEGEVSTGGGTSTPAINQVIFDQTYTAHDFNTNPVTIDNLQGDSFDYTLVINGKAVSSSPDMIIRLNNDTGANYRRYRMLGQGGTSSAYTTDSETSILMDGGWSSSRPNMHIMQLTGSSGSERLIDIIAATDSAGASRVKKTSAYWKNTADEVGSVSISASNSLSYDAHIRVYATPKAATTDNWELVETKTWTASSADQTFSGLTGDTDEKYKLVVNSNASQVNLRFNGDTGSNYTRELLNNESGTINSGSWTGTYGELTGAGDITNSTIIVNAKSGQKRIYRASTSSIPATRKQVEGVCWWNNTTDEITSISLINLTSDTGSASLYKKKDPAGVADKYNLPFQKVAEVDINGDFSAGHVFDNLSGDSQFLYKLEFLANSPGGSNYLHLNINSDTSANYSTQRLWGSSSTTGAISYSGRTYAETGYVFENSSNEIYIYPKSGQNRTILSKSSFNENQVTFNSNWWSNTSDEITSIKVSSSTTANITGKLILSAIPLDTSSQSSGGSQQQSGGSTGTYTAYVPTDFQLATHSAATSATGTVSASSQHDTIYAPWQTFDGQTGTSQSWYSQGGAGFNQWLKYEVTGTAQGKVLKGYTLTGYNHATTSSPKSWVVKVDGVVVDSVTNSPALGQLEKRTFANDAYLPVNSDITFEFSDGYNTTSNYIALAEIEPIWVEAEERTTVLTSVDTSSSIIPALTADTDQGYTVSTDTTPNGRIVSDAFDGVIGTSGGDSYEATQNSGNITIMFPTPQNISGAQLFNESNTTRIFYDYKMYVIDENDNEILVVNETNGTEEDPFHTWHFEGNAKGFKLYIGNYGNTNLRVAEVKLYSGTYATGQPQKPFIISSSKIAQNEGTPIGDMTDAGGLASAFNGSLHETYVNVARTVTTDDGFIGKDWGAGNEKAIGKVILYSCSNLGYFNTDNFATYTLQYSDDGTTWNNVHSVTEAHTNTSNQVKEILIPNPISSRYFRLYMHNSYDSYAYMSELEFFEAKALDGSEYSPLKNPIGFSSANTVLIPQSYGNTTGDHNYIDTLFNGTIESSPSASGTGHTAGKNWGVDKTINKIIVYGPTSRGIYTNPGDLIIDVEGWNGTSWENVTTKTFVGDCPTSNFIGEIDGLNATHTQHRVTVTSSFGDSSLFLSELEFYEGTPYFELPAAAGGTFSVGQVALSSSSTYTTGVYPTFSGENAIEMLTKTGDFSLEADFLKMTLKRTEGTFDAANFQNSEGYKVDGNYTLTGTTSSSIYIYPPKLLRRVNNPPTDFDNLGRPKEGVTVDIDNGTGGKVFYGVFQFEFALSQAISENVTVDVYMKTADFDFKKVAEIKPTPKPANAEDPWIIRNYWNARASQFDWDGNAYKTTGAVQFKFEVR